MEKIIIIVGPTAVGKTSLSVKLRKNFKEKSLVVILCKYIKK